MRKALLTHILGGAPSLIRDVLFDVGKIYRNNTSMSLNAIAAGVTVANARWEVRRMSDNVLVALGFGMSASLSVTTVGYYKVIFKAQTLTDQYVRQWDDVFVWYPKFTEGEADIVINLASGNYYNDFASANNSGKKIYVKGSGTGYFAALNLWGTAGYANYVRVQKETGNTQIVQTGASGADGITFTGARYVMVDAYNDNNTYGWKLNNPTGSNFEFRCENTAPVTNLHIMGLELNRTGASTDRAGISIIPPVNTTYNATNWVYANIAIHNCKVTNSGAEGIYLMYTNDTPQATFTPPKARDVVIAWNTVNNSGNDAIQNSSCVGSTKVHDNTIDTWGIQGQSSHEAAFSWNEGNAGLCYNNYAINGKMAISAKSGLKPWDVQAGETTPQRVAFYNNVFIEGTPPAVGSAEPVFSYFQCNNTGNAADWPVQIFNNTFLCNKLGITFAFNSAGGFTIPTLKLFNNVFVKTGGANEYSYTGAGTYPTSPVINNVVRSFSSYADLLFTSGTNLRPSSLSSPLFTGATNTSTHISSVDLNDADGLPDYDGSAYTHGAFGRTDFKTVLLTGDAAAATFTTPVAVGSLTLSGGTVTYESNKEGILYWVVVANNDTAPTAAQIILGKNAAGNNAISSGSILDGGTAGSSVTSGGTEGTAYDLYYVFKTKDFVTGTVGKVDFTTTADSTAPVLSNFRVLAANPNRLLFDSAEIITGTTFGGFTISGVVGTTYTVTGITVAAGLLTGHYFTLSANLGAADVLAQIAYSGTGSNIQDAAQTPNALASFAATNITNSIATKRVNINLTSATLTADTAWNNADANNDVATVRDLVANLKDSTNTNTGYVCRLQNAFHAWRTLSGITGNVYYTDVNVIARGFEVYQAGDAAGTIRISGLPANQQVDIVYAIFNNAVPGTGTVTFNGGNSTAFNSTTYTEFVKRTLTADSSGIIDIVVTASQAGKAAVIPAISLFIY